MERIKTVLNWSSGKDAALAYHLLSNDSNYEVVKLLTTVNDEHDRVVMHGVREELLDAQSKAIGIALQKIKLPAAPDDETYKNVMQSALLALKEEGIHTAAYGDIFLEDLKIYREEQLKTVGFDAVFPLWKKNTTDLVEMIEDTGIETMIVCVNEKFLGKEFLGRKIDRTFLHDLPGNVDPCGENGEYHTFVYNAPYFKAPVFIKHGEIVYKRYDEENIGTGWDKGFYFLDLLLDK